MIEDKSKNEHKPETFKEMKNKIKKKYFSKKQIMEKFSYYRKPGQFRISDIQYDAFCDAISILSEDIVEKIEREIYFVSVPVGGFYINLQSEDVENKNGVIYINPFILELVDKEKLCCSVYHEIAHHILGHKDVKNSEEEKKNEDAADKLAEKWWQEYFGR